jgi:hypothetical protein
MIHWDWIKTYFVASAIELACILDKTSEVVRLICAKCGKVMNP